MLRKTIQADFVAISESIKTKPRKTSICISWNQKHIDSNQKSVLNQNNYTQRIWATRSPNNFDIGFVWPRLCGVKMLYGIKAIFCVLFIYPFAKITNPCWFKVNTDYICWFSSRFWDVHDYHKEFGGEGDPMCFYEYKCHNCGKKFGI